MKGRSNVEKEITLEGMLEKLCVRLCAKFTWLNIVVSTAMDFRGSDVRDSNPGRSIDFSLLQNINAGSGAHQTSY
jgi:hypothetical protein